MRGEHVAGAAFSVGVMLVVGLFAGGCDRILSFQAPVVASDAGTVDLAPPPPEPDLLPPPVERCDNGLDDDGDGRVDCADEDCAPGFACAPAPAGSRFLLLGEGAQASCPEGAGAPVALFQGLDEAGACDAAGCSCGTAAGGCTLEAKLLMTACMGGMPTRLSFDAGACTDLPAGILGASIAPPTASVSCPAAGNAVLTRAKGTLPATACALVTRGRGGCAAGEACVPRAPAPFRLCVETQEAACPAGLDTRLEQVLAVDDRRACACTCTPDPVTCAPATVGLYGAASCMTETGSVASDNTCVAPGGEVASIAVISGGRPTAPPRCTPGARLGGTLSVSRGPALCCTPP